MYMYKYADRNLPLSIKRPSLPEPAGRASDCLYL